MDRQVLSASFKQAVLTVKHIQSAYWHQEKTRSEDICEDKGGVLITDLS